VGELGVRSKKAYMAKSILIAIVLTYFALPVFFYWRFRHNISVVFSRNQFSDPNLSAITVSLEALNSELTDFSFTADRVANILLRGQPVSLIYGSVGSLGIAGRSGNMWHSKKCVYAFADAEQSNWMRQSGDIFELAVAGTSHSVFWVKLVKIKTEQDAAHHS